MSEREFREKVFERLDAIDARMKRDTVRTIALLVAALCLIAAGVSVGVAITSREALHDQQITNQVLLCAQGRTTAAGAAFRDQRPNESREQFLDRMLAQRFQLLALGHLDCPNLPGFDTFAYQRGRALAEIDELLRHLAPRRYHQIVQGESAAAGESLTPDSPGPISELPPSSTPVGGGGSGDPGSSGGTGDSTGGSGNPPSKPHPPKPPHEGGGGGGSEGGGGTAPPPPVIGGGEQQPPAEQGSGGDQGDEEAGTPGKSGQQSVLSPALDGTCTVPAVSKLLCAPR